MIVQVSMYAEKLGIEWPGQRSKKFARGSQPMACRSCTHLKLMTNYHLARCCLISSAFDESTSSTASTMSVHVGGGSICFSHSDSIACRQSLTPSSSLFMSIRTWLSTPRRVPMVFQLLARGSSFLKTSLSFGLSSDAQN